MANEALSPGTVSAAHSTTPFMAEESPQSAPSPSRWKRRLTVLSLLAALVAAAVVLPPLINVSRYQRQITALISQSLGRTVRLSDVKLRLLPRPGFILHNLAVGESAEFGVEPMVTAQTVVASIRLATLWRGKLEIDRVSVDEASLNLVQSSPGRWNLESIMMGPLVQGMNRTAPTTAPQPAFSSRPAAFPYLEATNSRVNLKKGPEKTPYSLLNTQLSFWQESPGVWRLRLRGQPARTDIEMSSADTGELRVEATLQTLPAHEMRDMPLNLQAEWRDAQLGQLSRLLLGSDEGWRGDMTADLDLHGTADAAQTRARLRATGVRREEFAPAVPLDFDANCTLLYHHSEKALRNIGCDTTLGSGRLHLKADLPGNSGHPEAELAVQQLPMQAGLDMLRSLRDGFAPGLVAEGKVDGTLSLVIPPAAPAPRPHGGKAAAAAAVPVPAAANVPSLQGSLTISGGVLRSSSLQQPLVLPKFVLAPARLPDPAHPGSTIAAIGSKFTIPLGPFPVAAAKPTAPAPSAAASAKSPAPESAASGDKPADATEQKDQAPRPESSVMQPRTQQLAVRLALLASGYQFTLDGAAAPARLRGLAYALGIAHSPAADALSDGTADVSVSASGPWIASANLPPTAAENPTPSASAAPAPTPASLSVKSISLLPPSPISDQLTGSIQLHHVVWTAPYLGRPVEISDASILLNGGTAASTGNFVFGPLKGSASLGPAVACATEATCPPQLQIRLGTADSQTIESALLGAQEKKSVLAPLISRMQGQPKWPEALVSVQADSVALGPLTLRKPVVKLKMAPSGISIESWQASLLNGSAQGTGSSSWSGSTLQYVLEGNFTGISGAALGTLFASSATPAVTTAPGATAPGATALAQPPADDADPAPPTPAAWSGRAIDGSGKVQLSGLTDKDISASAAGSLHFHWLSGSIPVAAPAKTPPTASKAPAAPGPMRFDDWSGDATIGGGKVELNSNILRQGQRRFSVAGSIPFGAAPRLTVAPAAASAPPPPPAKPAR